MFASTAQEAIVKRVELTNNLAAAKYPKPDLNGNPTAVVIVQVIADNVNFLGNVIPDGVVKKQGEYWVYMGTGTKELHVHSDNFLPVEIRFPEYGIPRLESSATYVVTIARPETPAAQPASTAYNYLVLKVTPPDAHVIVDGKVSEVRNGIAKVLLRGGATYAYRVEAPGYIAQEGNVAMADRREDRTVELKSTKGIMAINTTTKGTDIYVNGEKTGTDQWRGELLPNDYLVEGRREGYRPASQVVSVATGQTTSVTIPALTAITGSLNIDFEPEGATITIDGTPRGITPNVIPDLLVGKHSVTISAPGHDDYNGSVTVKEGEMTALTGSLAGVNAKREIVDVPYTAFFDEATGLWGYRNEKKAIAIYPKYQYANDFSEGLGRVRYKDKIGYINKNDIFIIEPVYKDAFSFQNGRAEVFLNGRWFFIDKNGREIK